MSDETPRYEPYLNESEGHTFSLGMDGHCVNEDDSQTEPSYFTDRPEYDLKALQDEERRPYSLGLQSGLEQEETEPEILVNPPEYDLEELTAEKEESDGS